MANDPGAGSPRDERARAEALAEEEEREAEEREEAEERSEFEARGATLLLALAAVAAAVIAGRASILNDRGAEAWHAAVREHIKQMAAMVEDVRYLYENEAPLALRVLEAEIRAEEYAGEARRASGQEAALLRVEAETNAQLADVLIGASEIAGEPDYRLEDGGFDLVQRLQDLRALNPDLVALDPSATEARGTELALKGSLLFLAVVPVAVAFLLGALVQGFPARRRPLVIAGFAFILLSVAWAVAVEVTA